MRSAPPSLNGSLAAADASAVDYSMDLDTVEGIDSEQPSFLVKIFLILNVIAENQPISLAELTMRSGMPKSTVHRITRNLLSNEVIVKHPSGYQLGLKLFILGVNAAEPARIRAAAMPYMEEIYESCHETVHLGVLAGPEVVYLEKISGSQGRHIPTHVGARMPAHCVGLGKAMLAYADRTALDEVVANGLQPLTAATRSGPGELYADLRQVLERGLAYDDGEAVPGINCIAAPVFDWHGRVIAAISVAGPTRRMAAHKLAPTMRAAAASISRQFGYRPGMGYGGGQPAVLDT
jgi:DNA-binding IclR family transcriptional regulator